MSDRRIAGFDFEVVQDAVRQPPLDQLYAKARKRRRRGSSAIALAAVVALAVGSFVSLATGLPGTDRRQPYRPESPPSALDVTDLFVVGDESAVAVHVGDNGCSVGFAWTEDLGRTWSPFRQLRYEGACDGDATDGSMTVITYHPLNARTYLATVDGRSYLSTDEGRTWRDAKTVIAVVNAFPPQADPVVCQPVCDGLTEPLAVDPETSAVFRLRTVPSPRLMSMYESPDGALWATFAPRDSQTPPMVARSVDRGANWKVSSGPEQSDVVGVAGVSGQEAFLLAEPRQSGAGAYASGTSRLLRTTDGGGTWADVQTDLPTAGTIRPFTLGTDRDLLVADGPIAPAGPDCSVSCDENERYVWVSHDGGRHFTKGPAVSGSYSRAVPGRIWVLRQDSYGQDAHVTTNGSTWVPLLTPQ